ncbi:MAG: nuclease A inhibitor family protein [Armatimonadota bacterium]
MTAAAENDAAPDPLMERITGAADGLYIISETDSPLTPFCWQNFFAEGGSRDVDKLLRSQQKLPEETLVEIRTLEQFFKVQIEPAEGDDEEIIEEKRRLAELRDLLEKELQETAVYRTGEIKIMAYVLGRIPGTNDAAGVSAELVET